MLSGAALRGQGVEALLDAVVDFLPPPAGDAAGALCGVVFAVTMDKTMGRGAQVRLYREAAQRAGLVVKRSLVYLFSTGNAVEIE